MKAAGHGLVDDVTKLNTGLIGRLMKHTQIEFAWYFNGAVYDRTQKEGDINLTYTAVLIR